MALRINLNTAALNAHRQLQSTDNALSTSIERLSSGFRINRAADDPAGLAISENLRAQISGLGQAIRNTNDAVNMIKTAEGALAEVHTLLRNMRDLALHASNTGSLDSTAIAADQTQIEAAITALNRIATNTAFGNKKLLDGSGGITTTVTGSSITGANFTNSALTTGVSFHVDVKVAATKATLTGSVDTDADLSASTLVINGTSVSGGATMAATLANINAVTNTTGVVATAEAVTNNLVLTQVGYGSENRITVTGGTNIFGSANAAAIGVNATAEVTSNGTNTGVTDTGSNGLWNQGKGLQLKDSLGNTIDLTTAANSVSDKGIQGSIAVGTLTFQVGANSGETTSVSLSGTSATTLGVNSIDVSSDAAAALTAIDAAIASVSTIRANLGAEQKNMEATINSLSISRENIAASESSVRDTDMASEMVTFTRNQILLQAGTAMLTQANSAPQALLALLR